MPQISDVPPDFFALLQSGLSSDSLGFLRFLFACLTISNVFFPDFVASL